ncbi:MAG: M28 family peptidase [Saprospiraceae bacterium]|nr:M28 family peptidase [Saprospiraceae bacterium]
MKNSFLIFSFILAGLSLPLIAQTNFSISDPFCFKLLKGEYPRDTFASGKSKIGPQTKFLLSQQIQSDSLFQHLESITAFRNRNTISDFPEWPEFGIRGARNKIKNTLIRWNQIPGNTIFPCEFEFDYTMCGKTRHTQLLAILPGSSEIQDEIVLVEAHLDSRCEALCDTSCRAEGADDNGSGSALIMELTRVLSQFEMNRTIVVLWTTGEEQGLGGARAFALFCKQNGIKIKAVFNNDIVGGIECGNTSSPPSCPGPGQLDSTRLRIFSSGTTNSMSKNQARLTKLIIDQTIRNESIPVPFIDVMFAEDRTGRGGDHIPFREQGYTSIRFTSSYEHGDGNPSQANYHDRQHTTRDLVGKDLNGDGQFDSLFVDFNYLKRNVFVNAWTVLHAATTKAQALQLSVIPGSGHIKINIENPQGLSRFVYAIRRINSAYFDTVILSDQTHLTVEGLAPSLYYVTAAGIDEQEWYSMFGNEYQARVTTSTEDNVSQHFIELLQNKPNPFDEFTLIPIIVHQAAKIQAAILEIRDERGLIVHSTSLHLKDGVNEILLNMGNWVEPQGIYFYTLVINGKPFTTRKMFIHSY